MPGINIKMKPRPVRLTRHLLGIDGHTDPVHVTATDHPGAGGAYHEYDLTLAGQKDPALQVRFQNGPIDEAGPNGVTNEALLAVVEHRLAGFQSGRFPSIENGLALNHVRAAIEALKQRTRDRIARWVEGQSKA